MCTWVRAHVWVWLSVCVCVYTDTVGESGLTQFLMSEVTRLQKGLAEERRRRQAASAAAVGLQEADRQQQLKERELQVRENYR